MTSAEIITIGTELLLGETADTNTRFIARLLCALGIDLHRTQTVGDNAARITETVQAALGRAEIVITTGGLGPTVDDPTRQALAATAGVDLEYHPELWEQIKARITRYGRTPTENQKRQAYIPRGAIILENPVGTAPAFIINTKHGALIALPGVPSEMETLLTEAVVPFLQKRFCLHEIILVRTLHVSGIGEGALDQQIGDLETLSNPTVGLSVHPALVDIRITAKAGSESEARQMIGQVEKDLRLRLAGHLFGADDDTLEGTALEALAQHGWSLACFESGMDGALLNRFSQARVPGYRGGRRCQVPQEALAGAVEATRGEFGAEVCLGSSLDMSGSEGAISLVAMTPHGQQVRHLPYTGHPKNAARWAANTAIDWLRRLLLEIG